MLSYQHGYHAGGFADVIKHVTLTRLCRYLVKKDQPLFYLETHSGRGRYDLHSVQALKTAEAEAGIGRLWPVRSSLPPEFLPYMQCLQRLNPHGVLRYYPGSPLIAAEELRAMDRLYCCELHPQEFTALEQLKVANKRLFVAHTDGVQQLSALLPPPERRGLIFIDPAYEVKSEYQTIPQAIQVAVKRFPQGVYCLWYPILDKHGHRQLIQRLANIAAGHALRVELDLGEPQASGMQACGLWIMNPPYVLAEELTVVLKTLTRLVSSRARFVVEN